jgi:hypothetical protein
MREVDHDNLEYEGAPGENVTISVTPDGTNQLVQFTINGITKQLLAGSDINFNLGSSGQTTNLQILFDFNSQGRYDVVIENVANCSRDTQHTGNCPNRVTGPPRQTLLFGFFVK